MSDLRDLKAEILREIRVEMSDLKRDIIDGTYIADIERTKNPIYRSSSIFTAIRVELTR